MIKKNNFGFTLIELLVSISIIITATTIIVAIITASFRGSSKSTISDRIRESGNSAMTQITKTIQYADRFNGVSTDGTDDNLVAQCPIYDSTLDKSSYAFNQIRVLSNGQETQISCNDDQATINSSPIFDSKTITVSQCTLTCSQANLVEPPIVGISFDLSSNNPDSKLPEADATIHFSTNIKMRNINQ